MISAFNVIVVRTYIQTIPESLVESARIDGAEILKYLCELFFLCKPSLAVVGMFTIIYQWNSWFDTYLYARQQELSTLQYELQKLLAFHLAKHRTESYQSTAMRWHLICNASNLQAAITTIAMCRYFAYIHCRKDALLQD